MSDTKLKPCPFCGSEAKYIENRDFFISRFVTCTKCGIETRRNYLKKSDAIRDWNTRKPIDRIVEKLEEKQTDINGNTSLHYLYSEGYSDAIDYLIDIVKGDDENE